MRIPAAPYLPARPVWRGLPAHRNGCHRGAGPQACSVDTRVDAPCPMDASVTLNPANAVQVPPQPAEPHAANPACRSAPRPVCSHASSSARPTRNEVPRRALSARVPGVARASARRAGCHRGAGPQACSVDTLQKVTCNPLVLRGNVANRRSPAGRQGLAQGVSPGNRAWGWEAPFRGERRWRSPGRLSVPPPRARRVSGSCRRSVSDGRVGDSQPSERGSSSSAACRAARGQSSLSICAAPPSARALRAERGQPRMSVSATPDPAARFEPAEAPIVGASLSA
jgi:hypothetical protein